MSKTKNNKHLFLIIMIILFIILLVGIIIGLFFILKPKKDTYKPRHITFNNNKILNVGDEFITWDPSVNEFQLKGKTFYATGCNIPWMGFAVSNLDIKTLQGKCFTQPHKEVITNILKYAHDTLDCNVIRCHTLGFSAFSEDSFIPTTDNKINEKYWEIVDFIIVTAKQLGLHLIPVLTDQYHGYNGNYNIFLGPGEQSDAFYDINSIAYKNYKSFVNTYLNHEIKGLNTKIKDEPTIFCIEFGNELGDHSLDDSSTDCKEPHIWPCACPDGPSLTIQPTQCLTPTKEWISDITKYIKSIDQNHLLMVGTNWCQMEYPYASGKCDWDFDEILGENIAKLKKRYPGGFTKKDAKRRGVDWNEK